MRSQADRDAVTLDIATALALALVVAAVATLIGWLFAVATDGPADWDDIVRTASILGVAVLVGRLIRVRRLRDR